MTKRPSKPGGDGTLLPVETPSAPGGGRVDSAFDLWLKRGLHQLFDETANEPIPDWLLKMVDEDRKGPS